MSDIKKNIEKLLFESNISMYEVSKATGIAQTTLSRFVRKESDIENMSLKNALKLNEFYNKNKGVLEMKSIINELRVKFLIDGETERYATMFESKDDVIFNHEIDREIFEETFSVNIDEVKFPIITFDNSNAVDGRIYEADSDREDILEDAEEYFEVKQ